MPKLLREIVAENIKKERVKSGLTQLQLAKKAKLTDVYISRIERSAKNITLDSVEQIASALHIPITALIKDNKVIVLKTNLTTIKSIEHAVKVLDLYIHSLRSESENR